MDRLVDQPVNLDPEDDAPEPSYLAWKREKIERALVQAQDRSAMLSAEQLLHDLKIER